MRADHEPKEDVFTMGFKNEHTMALFSTSKELNNMKIQEYLYLIQEMKDFKKIRSKYTLKKILHEDEQKYMEKEYRLKLIKRVSELTEKRVKYRIIFLIHLLEQYFNKIRDILQNDIVVDREKFKKALDRSIDSLIKVSTSVEKALRRDITLYSSIYSVNNIFEY